MNVHKLDILPVAFYLWLTQWQKSKLIIYTDNITVYNDFQKFSLYGLVNKPLQKIQLLMTQNNIS